MRCSVGPARLPSLHHLIPWLPKVQTTQSGRRTDPRGVPSGADARRRSARDPFRVCPVGPELLLEPFDIEFADVLAEVLHVIWASSAWCLLPYAMARSRTQSEGNQHVVESRGYHCLD